MHNIVNIILIETIIKFKMMLYIIIKLKFYCFKNNHYLIY